MSSNGTVGRRGWNSTCCYHVPWDITHSPPFSLFYFYFFFFFSLGNILGAETSKSWSSGRLPTRTRSNGWSERSVLNANVLIAITHCRVCERLPHGCESIVTLVRVLHPPSSTGEQVAHYEQWRHIDVDKVMVELDRKEAELRSLASLRDTHGRQTELSERKATRQVKVSRLRW